MGESNTGGELAYRLLERPAEEVAGLFRFAGAWAPPAPHAGWGAWDGAHLVGAALLERAGGAAMLHGPVVIDTGPAAGPGPSGPEPLEVAGRLLAEALAYSGTARIDTVYARPQGLDRLWVRSGFIPVPEAELPGDLRGRPGAGLFGWRGGTALWSAAGRGGAARAAGRR